MICGIKKLNNADIHAVLDALGAEINQKISYINSGGCCVFAACIGEELKLRGIETNIIVAASWGNETNINQAREKILVPNRMTEWNGQGIHFHHVGVEYIIDHDSFHYDSNGSHHADVKLGEWMLYEGRMSVEDAAGLANEAEGWNTCFSREDIPTLKRFIRKFLHINLPVVQATA